MSKQFDFKQFNLANVQSGLFQTVKFSINTQFQRQK